MTEDGMSATVCMNDGDTHNSPVEQFEAKHPFVILRRALRPDSGGAGRHRGGLGIEQAVEARAEAHFNAQVDRMHCAPWGLEGGLPGSGNQVVVRSNGVWKEDFPNAKVLSVRLKPGDAIATRSGGGGGFGSPLDRPVADVAHDVEQGYVTPAAAERDYGIVCDPKTGRIDASATERVRAAKRTLAEAGRA
jgi:N-methylhydantoinase B